MAWTLLIRNGTVVDGSGAPGYAADVAVEGARIVAMGRRLVGGARRTIDAAGFTVAPGFIDIHSHSDLFYLGCPAAESKLRQGVTTEVVGVCSFSPAPGHPAGGPGAPAPARPRPGEPPPLGGGAAGDGAPARRGPGGGRVRVFHGARLSPQRLRRHRGARRARQIHGSPRRPLLLPHPGRGGDAGGGQL